MNSVLFFIEEVYVCGIIPNGEFILMFTWLMDVVCIGWQFYALSWEREECVTA